MIGFLERTIEMIRPGSLSVMLAVLALSAPAAVLAQAPAPAAPKAKAAAKAPTGTPFAGFGSNSKEPIKIDANKLEVFDKESKAIFSGDVVAVQGQTNMRCDTMIVVYAQNKDGKGAPARTPAPAPAAGAGATGQSSIKSIDCDGKVSLLSGTQSATANKLVYEAEKDLVTLTGKVVIADCDNVQRGERAVYDVKTGKATVDAGATGRVQGVFTPGNDDKKGKSADNKECPTAAPAAAAAPKANAPKAGDPKAADPKAKATPAAQPAAVQRAQPLQLGAPARP